MTFSDYFDFLELLHVAVAGLLGVVLSPLANLLIAKALPRLGGLPPLHARVTTAALAGVLCAAFGLRLGADPSLPAFMFLAVVGVQLARIDISLHLLPNPLVASLFLGGLLLFLVSAFAESQWAEIIRAVAGAAILFAVYLVLALASPGALGMGDVKLAAPVGLYLGYLGWHHLMYGGLLGFVLNGVVTALVLRRKSQTRATEVAHGPSMLTAAAAVILFMA